LPYLEFSPFFQHSPSTMNSKQKMQIPFVV
jgi:hypothetical protein